MACKGSIFQPIMGIKRTKRQIWLKVVRICQLPSFYKTLLDLTHISMPWAFPVQHPMQTSADRYTISSKFTNCAIVGHPDWICSTFVNQMPNSLLHFVLLDIHTAMGLRWHSGRSDGRTRSDLTQIPRRAASVITAPIARGSWVEPLLKERISRHTSSVVNSC